MEKDTFKLLGSELRRQLPTPDTKNQKSFAV
jgi:hypothetical protein